MYGSVGSVLGMQGSEFRSPVLFPGLSTKCWVHKKRERFREWYKALWGRGCLGGPMPRHPFPLRDQTHTDMV